MVSFLPQLVIPQIGLYVAWIWFSGGYVYIYHSTDRPYAWKQEDGYTWSEILHQVNSQPFYFFGWALSSDLSNFSWVSFRQLRNENGQAWKSVMYLGHTWSEILHHMDGYSRSAGFVNDLMITLIWSLSMFITRNPIATSSWNPDHILSLVNMFDIIIWYHLPWSKNLIMS